MGRNVIATLLLLWMVSGHSFGQRVVCGIEQGRIAHMVRPEYPAAAKTAGIQGRVVLRALVDKKGQIQKLDVVSSTHPLLTEAAVKAVQQWRYVPYRLNGHAVEVETAVTVRFVLPRKTSR